MYVYILRIHINFPSKITKNNNNIINNDKLAQKIFKKNKMD